MVDRYGIYWVGLDPARGSKIAKTRPAVVVSDDMMNRTLATVVVCPLTSRLHPHWPFRVQAKAARKNVEIAVDQIRTIDKARIGERLGRLDDLEAEELRHVITEMYGVLSAH
jgi:mRNA interferase MazF